MRRTIAYYQTLLREKKISPLELTQYFLNEIKSNDKRIHAWVRIIQDRALNRARNLEKNYNIDNDRLPPLYGIPYGAKDIIYTKNILTEAGSKTRKGFVPKYDATIIKKLQQAGAIMLGKTTTTEFASTSNPPETRNPWNLSHTPGGSSSGSAAALAANMALFTLGTQTKGSLLRPAAYCALTSLKGTIGRVSKTGIIPNSWTIDHVGALTNSVEDTVTVYNVICGKDDQDPTTWYLSDLKLKLQEKRNYRIGILTGRGFTVTSEEIQKLFDEALLGLNSIGYQFKEIQLPDMLDNALEAHNIIERSEFGAYQLENFQTKNQLFGDYLQEYIRDSFHIKAIDYVNAQRIRYKFRNELMKLFNETGVDILVSPTTPTTAPLGIKSTGSPVYNIPFTSAGIPALTVPIGYSKINGLPVGMQLISPAFEEQKIIDVGYMYQNITNWHNKTPKIVAKASKGN